MGVSRLSSSSVTLADAIGMVVRGEGQKSPLMRPIHNPRFSKLTRIVSRHELDPRKVRAVGPCLEGLLHECPDGSL